MREYQVGELVDIAIKGALVKDLDCPGNDVFATLGLGSYRVVIPFHAPGVTVTRVAPKEWPPHVGDLWTDTEGDAWLAAATDGETITMYGTKPVGFLDALDVLGRYGPLTLVRRRGWTPPEPEAAPERDEQANVASGLRTLAGIIEAHRHLPTRYLTIHYCMGVEDGGLAALRAWAEALNAEVHDAGLDSNRRRHHNVDADLSGLSMHLFHIEGDTEPESVDEPASEPIMSDRAADAILDLAALDMEMRGIKSPEES